MLDLVAEWRALRRLGPLESVWEVQRTAEVEPLLALLRTQGIEGPAWSFFARTTQQFFAPRIPIAIQVPVDRAAEARALIASRTEPQPDSSAEGRPTEAPVASS